MNQRSFTFVSPFPLRIKRPGSGLMKAALVLCVVVILLGLMTGHSLLAAISPVSVALAYLLLRVGSKKEQVVHVPVECQIQLDEQLLQITYPHLDRRDGKGTRQEQWRFRPAQLKKVHCSLTHQFLRFEGGGEYTVQMPDRPSALSHLASFALVPVSDPETLRQIGNALAAQLSCPVTFDE